MKVNCINDLFLCVQYNVSLYYDKNSYNIEHVFHTLRISKTND